MSNQNTLLFWNKRAKQEVLEQLRAEPDLWFRYQALEQNKDWQQRFLDYLSGEKIMPLLYDSFFKKLFHPDLHPKRLESLLGCILGKKIKILRILPNEDVMIDGGALIIMDIIVELEDHSIANVEVQKIPYMFPAERMSCYSADLLIRQYSRVKGELGPSFTYQDLKKVYTIVLFEKTTKVFKEKHLHNQFLHIGKTTFDTGLNLNLLQEYYLVALDVFLENSYSKDNTSETNGNSELNAWLSLLTTETSEDAAKLVQNHPWTENIFHDMAEYLHDPREVLTMFSSALHQLDKNTELYMIEELERDKKILQMEKDSLAEEICSLTEETDALTTEKNALTEEKESLKQENNSLAQENRKLNNENLTLQQELTELKNRLALLEKK